MEKRNLTPLRNVLVRYLVVCGGGSIVILLVWWGLFMSLIRNGFLLPPVHRGAGVQRSTGITPQPPPLKPLTPTPLTRCAAMPSYRPGQRMCCKPT